jgi:hypothetical protein
LAKSKLRSKFSERVGDCKNKLADLNSMFNTFEIDDKKLEELLSQKESKELQEMMGPLKEDCQLELLGGKTHELSTSEIKIADIFGKFIEVMLIYLIFFNLPFVNIYKI